MLTAVEADIHLGEYDLSKPNEAGEMKQKVSNLANIIPHENYDINSNVRIIYTINQVMEFYC